MKTRICYFNATLNNVKYQFAVKCVELLSFIDELKEVGYTDFDFLRILEEEKD